MFPSPYGSEVRGAAFEGWDPRAILTQWCTACITMSAALAY
jgi:hypothetical protein